MVKGKQTIRSVIVIYELFGTELLIVCSGSIEFSAIGAPWSVSLLVTGCVHAVHLGPLTLVRKVGHADVVRRPSSPRPHRDLHDDARSLAPKSEGYGMFH